MDKLMHFLSMPIPVWVGILFLWWHWRLFFDVGHIISEDITKLNTRLDDLEIELRVAGVELPDR